MPCKVLNSISCYLLGHFRYIGYVLLKSYILFYHEILILAPIRKKERYVVVAMSYAQVRVISWPHYKIHCTSITEILSKQHKTRINSSIIYKNDKYHYDINLISISLSYKLTAWFWMLCYIILKNPIMTLLK